MRSIERILWASVVVSSIGLALGTCIVTKGIEAIGYIPARLIEATQEVMVTRRVKVMELYPLVTQRMEYISEYGCATYSSSFLVKDTLHHERWFIVADANLRLSYYGMGTVEAGFDLEDFEVEIIPSQNTDSASGIRIVATMGQPRILSTELDHSTLRYEVESRHTGSEFGREGIIALNRTLLNNARCDLIDRAIDAGILDRARENAVRDIEELVSAVGYEAEVIVQLRQPPEGSAGTQVQEDREVEGFSFMNPLGVDFDGELE